MFEVLIEAKIEKVRRHKLHTCNYASFTSTNGNYDVRSSIGTPLSNTSLIPRPSHHPVFDRLQYAQNRGGRTGIFYHMNDVSVYLGRQSGGGGGVPHRKNELEDLSCSF